MKNRSTGKGSVLALLLALAMPGAAAELLFHGDFEHGPIPLTRANRKAPWYNSGNPPVVVGAPDPVRHGRYAMKTVLDRRNSPVSYRTEVVPRMTRAQLGREYWYGFSIFLPTGYGEDDIWEIVTQWHGSPDRDEGENWRNPIMFIYTSRGRWTVGNRWDARRITRPKPSGRGHLYDGHKSWDLGRYERDVWTDWVFHVKWSYRADGFLQVWKNGEKVIDRKGPTAFNDKKGPYLKMGLYKGWRDREKPKGKVSRRVLYHDEVRIAGADGSYEAVAPPGPRIPAELRPPVVHKKRLTRLVPRSKTTEKAAARGRDPKAIAAAQKAVREAAAKATAHFRKRVVAGVRAGRREMVYVEVGGATARGRITSADPTRLVIALHGSEVPLPWDKMSPGRFAALAEKYVGEAARDRVRLAALFAAAGNPEKARQLLGSLETVEEALRPLVRDIRLLIRARR